MTTTNLGMTLPTVGADLDNWGNELNDNLNKIDTFAAVSTRQVLTSGTTYNRPANVRQLRIRMVGEEEVVVVDMAPETVQMVASALILSSIA